MKTVVMSLGGSVIIPDQVDFKFLHKFKKMIRKHYKNYKFAIVCGGGSIARKYINALKEEDKSERQMSEAGIRATRMNAMFMMEFFGKEANGALPANIEEVINDLKKNRVVFCGALRFVPHTTTDSTAAALATHLRTSFINITNIQGLYTANPKTHKGAKFIPSISWKEFEKKANKIKNKPGQHFVLDQKASTTIRKYRIKTYIVDKDVKNLDNLLKGKSFLGTTISG